MVRTQQPSILIRCEGSQTEPNYLAALVRNLQLTTVKIPRDHETDPLNLVKDCISALKKDRQLHRAFVVFDRDTHLNFAPAVQLAQQSPYYRDRLWLIRSYPCIETWLIHHFEECRRPMDAAAALARLKMLLPTYEKSDLGCLDDFMPRIDQALVHADRGLADAEETGELNPSTEMSVLVRYLREVANRRA